MCTKISGKFHGLRFIEGLFKPAGMKTATSISGRDIVMNRAAGYDILDNKPYNEAWTSPIQNATGSGGLYMSLKDLVQWNAAMDSDTVLSASIKKQMWTSAVLNDGTKPDYGFGWMVPVINGHQYMGHGGSRGGFQSSYRRFPDDKLAVIVLANSSSAEPHKLSRKIAALYIPDVKIVPPPIIPDTAPEMSETVRMLIDGQGKKFGAKITQEMREYWTDEQVDQFSKELRADGLRTVFGPIGIGKDSATYRVQHGKVIHLISINLDARGLIAGIWIREED